MSKKAFMKEYNRIKKNPDNNHYNYYISLFNFLKYDITRCWRVYRYLPSISILDSDDIISSLFLTITEAEYERKLLAMDDPEAVVKYITTTAAHFMFQQHKKNKRVSCVEPIWLEYTIFDDFFSSCYTTKKNKKKKLDSVIDTDDSYDSLSLNGQPITKDFPLNSDNDLSDDTYHPYTRKSSFSSSVEDAVFSRYEDIDSPMSIDEAMHHMSKFRGKNSAAYSTIFLCKKLFWMPNKYIIDIFSKYPFEKTFPFIIKKSLEEVNINNKAEILSNFKKMKINEIEVTDRTIALALYDIRNRFKRIVESRKNEKKASTNCNTIYV